MDPINLTKNHELKLFDLQKEVEKVDINLKDLFDIVYKAEIENAGIADALGMPNFEKFYDEINNSYKQRELKFIELYWELDYEIKRTKTGKLEEDLTKVQISPQMGVHAIGEHHKDVRCPPNCKIHNSYAIEFTQLNELANLPIKIKTSVEIGKTTLTINPSLYQLINSIFWELTFVGYTPKERDEKKDDLVKLKEEAEDELLKEQGTEIIKDALDKKDNS